jgi:hypothetical protein
MSRQTKIIIGVVAGFIVLCLAICVVGAIFTNIVGKNVASDIKPDPEKAAKTASEIVDFTPPSGFQPMSGFKILGYTVVIYDNGSESKDLLMLMQIPGLTEIDDATIQQFQQAMERQSGSSMQNRQIVETRDMTIRGKPARVIIQEGTTGENAVPVRQMMVAFQGKGGVATLFITTRTSRWDQDGFNQMVESIH